LASPLPAPQRVSLAIRAGRRWVVLAMLLALHAALVSQPGEIFQRLWLLVHFGLFLLWQPFIAAERELDVVSLLMLLGITFITIYFVSGWMIVMWQVVLLGILGGRVFTIQAVRRGLFYLFAFAYVMAVMLLWAVPVLILGPQELPEPIADFAQRALPLTLLPLVFLPFPAEDEAGQVFDFFYAVLVFQLGVVLVLGSIVLMRYTGEDYVESLAITVLGFGFALFVFAMLWNPMRGFGGLRTYMSAYLMSVGMPFELWMRRVAELAETEPDPRHFLEESLREISKFPWMRGGRWRSPDGEGRFGEDSAHATRFYYSGLEVIFHTEIRLSPALFLHMRLLAQVVGEFYEGKRREAALRRASYLQAVHETGARLTHDVKNLLQSLYALTSMAPKESDDAYAGLLQRQLPQLSKRLEATLEKLRSPEMAGAELPVRATAWWSETERRLAGTDIELRGAIEADGNVPSTLFDSFVENALDNARAKRGREPAIDIALEFGFDSSHIALSVSDNGSAIPADVAGRLFTEPIERSNGLGIGLYHVARQAALSGWRLELAENRDGEVRFRLVRAAEG
jgi:hypothetical protein